MADTEHKTDDSAVKLLAKLVSIPSVSGNEKRIADFVQAYLQKNGIKSKRWKNNVWVEIGQQNGSNRKRIAQKANAQNMQKKNTKNILLLCSHLDTVKPAAGFKEPFNPKIADGKLYGLGSCDAKASAAAMLCAFIKIKDAIEKRGMGNKKNHKKDNQNSISGKVILALTQEEETGGHGMPELIRKLPMPTAAIVGEPTELKPCIAQKGLIVAKLIAKGKAAHASRPEKGKNAIVALAHDIAELQSIKLLAQSTQSTGLGNKTITSTITSTITPTITPTIISGGSVNAKNVIPDYCEVLLDIRTIPGWHEKILSIIKKRVKSNVAVLSSRLTPRATSSAELIAQIASSATRRRFISSTGMSDWAFIDCPAVKLGPGNPLDSHTLNESIDLHQVNKAVDVYYEIVTKYLC